jgi:hypothetical protein
MIGSRSIANEVMILKRLNAGRWTPVLAMNNLFNVASCQGKKLSIREFRRLPAQQGFSPFTSSDKLVEMRQDERSALSSDFKLWGDLKGD